MYLRQIAAVRSQLFPDVRHRIETDHINALIAEKKHVLRHIAEHIRVSIVQIPLIGIEGRHDDLARLLAPGKIPRRGRREDLRDVLFKCMRDRPVIIEEITVLIFLLPGAGAAGPLMILARVVHHKVETQRDAEFVTVMRKRGKIFHRAELRLNFSEIRYRIAAVASAFRTLQEWHEMQIIHAAVADIVQFFAHALKVPGK